ANVGRACDHNGHPTQGRGGGVDLSRVFRRTRGGTSGTGARRDPDLDAIPAERVKRRRPAGTLAGRLFGIPSATTYKAGCGQAAPPGVLVKPPPPAATLFALRL